ncbi:hypothetical protein D9M71_282990 [compost metagenome]
MQFEDTLAAPLAVIERIYRFAALPLSDEVRAAIQDWLAQNGREKRAAHAYDLEQFGLSENQLQQDYAGYRARHLNGSEHSARRSEND